MPAQNESRLHLKLNGFEGIHGVSMVQGQEALSELYYYDIQLVVENNKTQPDPADLIDSTGLLTFDPEFADNNDSRQIHGIVQWMRFVREDHRFHHYELRLSPQLWRLTQQSDNRIFQFKDVQTIITDVLKQAGFAGDDYQFIFQEPHPEREYCVQYRETHLEFLERLMAEEGIYYTFLHEAARHTLVMADTPTVEHPIAGNDTLAFYAPSGTERQFETIDQFGLKSSIRTGKFTHTDYDFKRPALELEKDFSGDTFDSLEHYDYHGRYVDPSRGGKHSQFRLEQHKADERIGIGRSNSVRLQTGLQFTLNGHEQPGHDDQYLITGLTVDAQQPQILEELAPEGEGSYYHAHFTCIPKQNPFRPPYDHKKPQVHGPHTAIVVGPEGEEIYVDEHGRVKVQFHWDRLGQDDEHSSVWMRVSQGWAGAAWGSMFIPRIGHEVIIDFLEGDIDRPLITGRVYHGTNVPPYPLPANKTVSTIKSQTHKGQGSNELRFEDENDREEIYLHAQKDHNTVIENDENHLIHHCRTKRVDVDQSESIGQDKTIHVERDHRETIDQDMYYNVGRNQQEEYGKDHVHTVGNIHKQDIFADHQITVGKDRTEQVQGNYTLDVVNSINNNTKTHTLMAYETFQIKGPGGQITIDASGITLEAANINLKGNVSMGGSGSAQVPTLSGAANEALPLCEECEKAKEAAS